MNDPGMIPKRRVPNLDGLITGRQARIAAVLSHDRGEEAGEVVNALPRWRNPRPFAQPQVPRGSKVEPHSKPVPMYDDAETRMPDGIARALANVIDHINNPGSIPYSEVGASADLVCDYFDPPITQPRRDK